MKKTEFTKTKKVIENVLSLMEVDLDLVSITDENDQIEVKLDLPDEVAGSFIGYQGETLSSLQLILSLVTAQRLGDWYPLRVDVGNYRERKTEALLQKADDAAKRAVETNQEIILPNLNSYERRLVHDHLNARDDVTTESRGNSPYRQLFVLPN